MKKNINVVNVNIINVSVNGPYSTFFVFVHFLANPLPLPLKQSYVLIGPMHMLTSLKLDRKILSHFAVMLPFISMFSIIRQWLAQYTEKHLNKGEKYEILKTLTL